MSSEPDIRQLAEDMQRLKDESAIRKVLGTYARAIDRQDYDLPGEVFHADAIDEHGFYNGSASGFAEIGRLASHATLRTT